MEEGTSGTAVHMPPFPMDTIVNLKQAHSVWRLPFSTFNHCPHSNVLFWAFWFKFSSVNSHQPYLGNVYSRLGQTARMTTCFPGWGDTPALASWIQGRRVTCCMTQLAFRMIASAKAADKGFPYRRCSTHSYQGDRHPRSCLPLSGFSTQPVLTVSTDDADGEVAHGHWGCMRHGCCPQGSMVHTGAKFIYKCSTQTFSIYQCNSNSHDTDFNW